TFMQHLRKKAGPHAAAAGVEGDGWSSSGKSPCLHPAGAKDNAAPPVAGRAGAGQTRARLRYPLFVRRDLDAFFGLAINNLVDLIIIATVGRTLLHLPDALILGRILPGAGLSLLAGNLYYSWQARQLALAEGRDDVTAQPFGLNTPTVFLFLYLVMYPVYV